MRRQNVILLLAVMVVAVLVVYFRFYHRTATVGLRAGAQTNAQSAGGNSGAAPGRGDTNKTAKVFLVRPDQVLATVNGVPITLGNLIPLQSTNNAGQQLDSVTYNYFLQRAINRELIMQAAKAQGVTLNQAQEDQLAKLRGERQQPYPGQVSQLSVNPTEVEFDLRDEQAFMLQTTLLAQAGASPDVTPAQVEQYYQDHIAQFGELPADPQARQQAWQEIDIQIRNQLAVQTREQYNQQLQKYMDGLRAAANITVTPLL